MMKLIMKVTEDYNKLVKFLIENDLEFDGDVEVNTDIVKCWEVIHGDESHLVGGAVLGMREGRYIIDGIAVDKIYRKMKIGLMLLDKVKEEVLSLGGKEIYLVARAPGFFSKYGFEVVNADNAPNFFECKQCPQYKKTCFPEIMKLVL